jgi:hypothetical protein
LSFRASMDRGLGLKTTIAPPRIVTRGDPVILSTGRIALIFSKRIVPAAAMYVGIGLASLTFLGGCSGDGTPPELTEAQKEQLRKEEQSQSEANNAASKASTQRRAMNPP